jgi:hypothetical protein
VGVIVTRDGYLRLFTVDKPFRVYVQGEGITQVGQHAYKVELL